MIPAKEKAKQILKTFDNIPRYAKKAVDEIIELRNGYFDCTNPMQDESYWQEVKKEIDHETTSSYL